MHDLKTILTPLYGIDTSTNMQHKLDRYIEELPQRLTFEKEPNWYKNLNFYITYPDQIEGQHDVPLQNLRDHLDWVKKLGCNAMHILPFMASPMIDKGFDISNFYTVRPELGTIEDIEEIGKRARDLNIKLFIDIVSNHISDQHEWFQKAQNGDEYYRNFFLYSKEKPEYIRRYNSEHGVYAEYMIDGKPTPVYIVFPDVTGEIPHWVQGKDGIWYYHTFYPQQLDVNWFNPEVFMEFSKILIHWASFGFHFRLDAIPFVGKGIYKNNSSDDKNTHTIVKGLYQVSRLINPNCAFLVETYESTQSVINYFGSTNDPETTLSYNFHLCTNTWLSLVKNDASYLENCFNTTMAVPIHGEWITFLRNHDEFSIAFIDDNLRHELQAALAPLGATFRDGHGLAGRTFSLLGKNSDRLLMAFTLIASLPGSMAIMYGDEVGMENVPLDTMSEADQKDTRNINRGQLKMALMKDENKKKIYDKLSDILHKRRLVSYYLNIEPELESINDKKVLVVKYKHGISRLTMLINITEQLQIIDGEWTDFEPVLELGNVSQTDSEVKLGSYGAIWLQK